METIEDTASAEKEAVAEINDTVSRAASSEELVNTLEGKAEEAEGAKQEHIETYIEGVRPQIEDVLMKDLGETGGGQFDGTDVTVGKASLYVYDDVQATVENAEEVRRHEDYHQENDHTAEMIHGDSAEGETVVTMGKQAFNRTAFIEGITVRRTGEQFVSDQYKRFRSKFDRALQASGQTVEDVEEAIKQKDLRLIDDANRQKSLAQSI